MKIPEGKEHEKRKKTEKDWNPIVIFHKYLFVSLLVGNSISYQSGQLSLERLVVKIGTAELVIHGSRCYRGNSLLMGFPDNPDNDVNVM